MAVFKFWLAFPLRVKLRRAVGNGDGNTHTQDHHHHEHGHHHHHSHDHSHAAVDPYADVESYHQKIWQVP